MRSEWGMMVCFMTILYYDRSFDIFFMSIFCLSTIYALIFRHLVKICIIKFRREIREQVFDVNEISSEQKKTISKFTNKKRQFLASWENIQTNIFLEIKNVLLESTLGNEHFLLIQIEIWNEKKIWFF